MFPLVRVRTPFVISKSQSTLPRHGECSRNIFQSGACQSRKHVAIRPWRPQFLPSILSAAVSLGCLATHFHLLARFVYGTHTATTTTCGGLQEHREFYTERLITHDARPLDGVRTNTLGLSLKAVDALVFTVVARNQRDGRCMCFDE